jgi:hypothetical protein
MKIQIIVLIKAILIMNLITNCIAPDSTMSMPNQNNALLSQEEAISRALAYTGFDKINGYQKACVMTSEKVVYSKDNTPFNFTLINGHEVWRVKFQHIPLSHGIFNSFRDFEVLLNPSSGQLLSVYSISDSAGSSDTLPEPSPDTVEMSLNIRNIIFNALPEQVPTISFYDALQASMESPTNAKIIKGLFMDQTSPKGHNAQTWIIILRGLEPPAMTSGLAARHVPANQRNSIWCFINGVTGKCMFDIDAPLHPIRSIPQKQNK